LAVDYADILKDSYSRAFSVLTLLFTWISGILFGYFFYEPSFSSLMRSAVSEPVSIVGLFSCVILPLLCSCFFLVMKQPVLILIVCFVKAVSFGFSCGMLAQLFTSAAWLVRFLFLFSDSCFSIILLFLWLRRISDPHIHGLRDFFYCALIGIGIAFIDGFIISPYLQGLF